MLLGLKGRDFLWEGFCGHVGFTNFDEAKRFVGSYRKVFPGKKTCFEPLVSSAHTGRF